jgi:hypothetical protein
MWHEARRSERKVHDLMDAARRRAQRRAAYLARRRGDPQQALQVSGTRCRVHRDDALYQDTVDQQGLCVLASLYLSICFDATLGCSGSGTLVLFESTGYLMNLKCSLTMQIYA